MLPPVNEGNLIFLSGILLSLALIARGLPPFRRTILSFVLFCAGMFLLAGFFLWIGQAQARRVAVSASWLPAEAIVVRSEVVRSEPALPGSFVIEYMFQVGVDTYHGSTLRFRPIEMTDENLASLTERFSPGEEIEIHFDPRNPHRNVVWKETSQGVARAYVIGGSIAALPLFLILWRVFFGKKYIATDEELVSRQ
jgi:hypothetical protein